MDSLLKRVLNKKYLKVSVTYINNLVLLNGKNTL